MNLKTGGANSDEKRTLMVPWRRLLSSVSTFDALLPYNWNWQRRWTEVSGFLEQHPIVLMDIGARGEAPPELDSLRAHVRRIGFEPDPDECRRLNDQDRNAKNQGRFFPSLVAGQPGPQTLNLYHDLAYSSVLTLSDRYQRLWGGGMAIDGELKSQAVTIDGVLSDHPDLKPDILKIDTQGTELQILEGAEHSLAGIGLVDAEIEFHEMYKGQSLFSDLAPFMAEQGFELLYLNRFFASRREVYQGPSRGQVVCGDALFGKREDQLESFTVEQKAKYAILLCQYGHVDISWQLIQENPELRQVVPGLLPVFRQHRNRPTRAALMQLDKVLALGLHLRQYNQRGADSDRSWPIR
jgi:FkbM family methyltransferase